MAVYFIFLKKIYVIGTLLSIGYFIGSVAHRVASRQYARDNSRPEASEHTRILLLSAHRCDAEGGGGIGMYPMLH